jgi:hypothetical protein
MLARNPINLFPLYIQLQFIETKTSFHGLPSFGNLLPSHEGEAFTYYTERRNIKREGIEAANILYLARGQYGNSEPFLSTGMIFGRKEVLYLTPPPSSPTPSRRHKAFLCLNS